MNAALDPRQIHADDLEVSHTEHDGRQAQIHTSMPGKIVSYDAAKMTATVQPCLQGFRTMMDGSRQPVTISPIQDVPVHFPGGGGHIFTFPVKGGDECLIVFSERSIDNWHQHGGVQQPSDWRMHDINDAFVMVGTRSQPGVPPGVDPDTVQMRSDDKKTIVQIDGKNKAITLYADGGHETVVFVDGVGGQVTINAPMGMKINAPYLHVTGAVIGGFGGGDQVGLQSHSHMQGSDSRGDGEVPVNPPTPGT